MNSFMHIWRLARSGRALALAGAALPPDMLQHFPLWLRLFLPKARRKPSRRAPSPLAQAFSRLGPSYIKLGQFLAVRPDIVGMDYARDLGRLHDDVPPFAQKEAEAEIKRSFNAEIHDLFPEFGAAVAAASIAQIHKARGFRDEIVAVKILRPGIEKKFMRDMESFFWAAHKVEKYHPQGGRLRPVDALKNLQATTLREMDLRMEAAAMSEMAENSAGQKGLYIPKPDWQRTSANVLTTEWIDGIAINDIDALKRAGHNLPNLAQRLLEIFLTHALHNGFFHADFHPGNLFIRDDGVIVPVDFGIMGRLEKKDRHAMAWILHGLTSGDYLLAAREHIHAGYVPADTNASIFAQALRAISEPILDMTAQDISMGELLWQLFETARNFQMHTQPQLLLLQKTMVATEGLARRLDPQLNIWKIAAPVIEDWQKQEYAPPAIAAQAAATMRRLWRLAPEWLDQAEQGARMRQNNSAANPPRSRVFFILALAGAFLAGLAASAAGFLLKLWPLNSF